LTNTVPSPATVAVEIRVPPAAEALDVALEEYRAVVAVIGAAAAGVLELELELLPQPPIAATIPTNVSAAKSLCI
jgi:acetylornithine deacetylase/succinyl-diaminopimelate desuccinylase-like protein